MMSDVDTLVAMSELLSLLKESLLSWTDQHYDFMPETELDLLVAINDGLRSTIDNLEALSRLLDDRAE